MNPDPRAAFVALGSNLEVPREQVLRALDALAAIPKTRCTGRSSLYRSQPLGPVDQPPFVNAVARLETGLAPRALLDALLAIERAHGRIRDGARWGPRTLDLDLLLYEDLVLAEPGLTLPHPGLTTRAFVLYPLAELAPDLVVPGAGPIHTLIDQVDPDGLSAIED